MFFLGLEEFSQGLIDEGTALVQQQQRGPSSKELFGWKMRQPLALGSCSGHCSERISSPSLYSMWLMYSGRDAPLPPPQPLCVAEVERSRQKLFPPSKKRMQRGGAGGGIFVLREFIAGLETMEEFLGG